MNNKKKKIFSMIIAAFGLILLVPAVTAMANTKVNSWSKSLTGGVWTFLNGKAVEKDTSSSVYLSYEGGGSSTDFIKATVYSSHTMSGTFERITYNGKVTPIYTIQRGGSQYMVNYVYETGQKYVKICAQSSNTNTCSGRMQIDLN